MDELEVTAPPGEPAAPAARESDRARLLECLDLLLQAGQGYEFILLRETPIGPSCIDEGDLDFLGDQASVDRFIRRVDALCEELGLNFRVIRATPRKTNVTVWSQDLRDRLDFDLWIHLWQIDGGRFCLEYQDVRRFGEASHGCVLRLTMDLEFAVYVQHLHAKHKDVGSAGVRRRLEFYATRLREMRHPDLADTAQAVLESGALGARERRVSAGVLQQYLGIRLRAWRPLRYARRVAGSLGIRAIRATMPFRCIAFVGADGAGKTTLGQAMQTHCDVTPKPEYVLGKSLYRESRIFRVLYGLSRRSLRIPPMRIDELFAPVAYSVGALRLICKLRSSREKILMLDRYLPDFLYLDRKKDRPRFSITTQALRPLCVALPVVHLSAPYASVNQRKGEVTEAGLQKYNEDMRSFYCSRLWVDYLRMRNSGSAEAAIETLSRHLSDRWATEQVSIAREAEIP